MKKRVEYRDIYEFSSLGGAKWSPDGRYAVFAENRADEDSNGYKSNLWLYEKESGKIRRLTSAGTDRFAFWEKSSGAVVFASRRAGAPKLADEKKPVTRYFRIFPDGGEAEHYFDVPTGVASITPITDDLYLVKSSEHALPEDERPKRKGYKVFDEIPFWLNGQGVTNKKRPALSLFSKADGSLKKINAPLFEAGDFALSPDKSKIVFCGSELIGAKRRQGGLYVYDIASDKTEELISPENACVDRAMFFDDNTIFFTKNPVKDSHSASVMHKYDLASRTWEKLADHDIGFMQAVRDGELIYIGYDEWSHSRISAINAAGKIVYTFDAPGSVQSFDVREGEIIFTGDSVDGMQELYRIVDNKAVRLSGINDGYVESREIIHAERFTFINRDGVEIEGFVIKPAGWEKGKKFPGLLEIHGGPKAAYNVAYNHEFQAYAAMGYYVFFCNPRGSSGRGSDFADVTGKLGSIDYDDVMSFTDEVLKREPELDEKKLGVLGGSYGGFMTNWIVGHTDRFAAAASQRSISNYFTKCLTTDIGHYHNLTQMETDPWHGADVFWDHSPLKYADKCVTPTLFIHSDHDFRCWFSEGIQMYEAIKRTGTDARICIFKDENHELSRSGKPKNRISRLDEMGKWFDKYLK